MSGLVEQAKAESGSLITKATSHPPPAADMGVSVSPAIAEPVDRELHNCGNRTRIEGTSCRCCYNQINFVFNVGGGARG